MRKHHKGQQDFNTRVYLKRKTPEVGNGIIS